MLCLVTDRHRLGGSPEAVVEQARAAVAAGVDLFQLRERDLEAAELAALGRRVVQIALGSKTRVVINDRLDIALASGADGVQLRGDSIAVAAARRLAPPGYLVGRSIHRVDEAIAAGDADYLVAGTVFATTSKGDLRRVLGAEGLRAITAAASAPVLAIGGMTLENIAEAATAGAAGVAAIGLFATTDSDSMRAVVEAARFRFRAGEQRAGARRFDSLRA
jgi:thiamine-phosphate pyrophosphorylase